MQKIVLDTDVVVASLISNGIPFKIINELAFEKKVMLYISDAVLEKYSEVLSGEKFSRYKNFKIDAEIIINSIKWLDWC